MILNRKFRERSRQVYFHFKFQKLHFQKNVKLQTMHFTKIIYQKRNHLNLWLLCGQNNFASEHRWR